MKAKFIAVNNSFEMRLENGTTIASTAGETKKVFLKRVTDETLVDLGELEIANLDATAFMGLTLAQLKTAKGKEKGLLVNLLESAIELKEAEVATANSSKEDAAKAKADKIAAEKAKKEAAKDAKIIALAEGRRLAEEAKAAKKAAKVEVVKPTLEEIQTLAAEAKLNVGHAVEFLAHGTAIKTEGVINGVWIDKRVPMALYRIFDANGAMFNKTIGAPDLKIGDLAPNPKAEAAAKAKLEKEAALVAKAEKIAAEKVEKEAAALAKAEKIAADKLAKEEAAKAKAEATVLAARVKAEAAKLKAEETAKVAAEKAEKLAELAREKKAEALTIANAKIAAAAKA